MLKRVEDDELDWPDRKRSRIGLLSRAIYLLQSALRLVGIWADRAKKRRQLAQMSERQIKDIGATRSDVVREINKPFWEA